jgi:hypothetical protein
VLAALFLFRRSGLVVNPMVGLVASFGIAAAVAVLVLFAIPAGRRALFDFGTVAAIILRKREGDLAAERPAS